MTEDEARKTGLPLSIGGASGDSIDLRAMRRALDAKPSTAQPVETERPENITDRNEAADVFVPVQEQKPAEQPVEVPVAPVQEPAPLAPQDEPVVTTVIAVPVVASKTLEEQIADAKKLLGEMGMDVVDRSDPNAAPVIAEELPIEHSFIATLKKPCTAYRAWRATVDFSKFVWGFLERAQAWLFFGVLAFLGLLDMANTIDIRAALKLMTGWEEERIGNFMVAMSIVGLLLRMVVTTPSFERWRRRGRGDGYAHGVGTGSVDEPV